MQAFGLEHLGEVGDDLRRGAGRDAVDHQSEDHPACCCVTKEPPRHRIAVTGGGGDEHPQIGGFEQLAGQLPVLADHRVDVGGIEDGQACRQRCRRHDLQLGRTGGSAAADPRQPAEHAVPLESGGDVRVMHQHRRGGRWPEDTGTGDVGPDDAVDQRRFAGPGRASDHRQRRCVQAGETGHDVVVQLLDGGGGRVAGRFGRGGGKRQRDAAQLGAQ